MSRPSLTAKVRPKRDKRRPFKYRTTGRVVLPDGVTAASGCNGTVRVTIKRKGSGKTLSSRRAKVRSSCKFSSKVRFKNSKRFGKGAKRKRGTLRFAIRFQGNGALTAKRVVRTAKYGRAKKK